MHSPTSITLLRMPSIPFPNSNATFPPRPLQQNSSSQLWPPHPTAPADLSQILHNPLGNEPHPPLVCYHTLHTYRH